MEVLNPLSIKKLKAGRNPGETDGVNTFLAHVSPTEKSWGTLRENKIKITVRKNRYIYISSRLVISIDLFASLLFR